MQEPLPKHIITKLEYSRTIEEIEIKYNITCTIHGEILDVTCPFLDLPPSARRLMISGDHTSVNKTAEGILGLLPFVMPLLAMNRLAVPEWDGLKAQLQAFTKNKHRAELFDHLLQTPWVIKAYQIHRQDGPKPQLFLVEQLLKEKGAYRHDALKTYNLTSVVNVYESDFIGPMLLSLLPLPNSIFTTHAIYKALSTYPTEAGYTLLTTRLKDPSYKKYHTSILKGLSSYRQAGHKEILHQFFFDNPLLGGEALTTLIKAVKKLPIKQRDQLLGEILTSDNRVAAIQAYHQLVKLGMNDKVLSKQLYPAFKARRSLENMRAILKLYDRIDQPEYLPTGTELLEVLQWANKDSLAIAINNTLSKQLAKRLDSEGFDTLLSLLKEETGTVQEAALKELLDLANEEHINKIAPVISLVPVTIQPKLTFLIRRILTEYSASKPIAPLLQYLQENKNLKLETITAINRSLRNRLNPKAIEPLIQELEHQNPSIRIKALITLRIFKDKKVVKAIEKLAKKESHAAVHQTATTALAWIASPLPESIKRRQERKEKINTHLEELIASNEQDNGQPLNFMVRLTMKSVGKFYYNYFPKKEWKE